MPTNRDHRQRRSRRRRPDPRLDAGIGDDVRQFGRSRVRRHRDRGHAGDQATEYGHQCGGRRLGKNCHPFRSCNSLGDRSGGAVEIGSGECDPTDGDRVTVVDGIE